jgi:hypothetical protein
MWLTGHGVRPPLTFNVAFPSTASWRVSPRSQPARGCKVGPIGQGVWSASHPLDPLVSGLCTLLWFLEVLKIFIHRIFEVNAIRFSMQQNTIEEMFFEDQERVFVFWFNQLIDGGARKLFKVEEQSLLWGNDKWLNADDAV